MTELSQNWTKLEQFLQELKGMVCSRATVMWPKHLVLEFGDKVAFDLVATPWLLKTPDYITAQLDYMAGLPEEIEDVPLEVITNDLQALVGAKVVCAKCDCFDFSLSFDNGCYFLSLAKKAEPERELPAWKLLLPNNRALTIWGPTEPGWECHPADMPAKLLRES